MNKQEFLLALEAALGGLPKGDVSERIDFYSEIIDDKIEEGLTEEEAIATVGSIDEIAAQILADIPLSKIAKQKIKSSKRRLSTLEIVLLVLGAPIWLSLLVSAFSVVLSIYPTLWALIASLWVIMGALAGAGLGVIVGGAFLASFGNTLSGVALIGVGLFSLGLAIFLFFGCEAATKGAAKLTKNIVLGIKKALTRKEAAK